MSQPTVGPRTNLIAQELHADCDPATSHRHSWVEHQKTAARVDAALGGGLSEKQLKAAFQRGFHSRDGEISDMQSRADEHEREGQRLTQMLGKAAAAHQRLRDRLADLALTHDQERRERNNAVAAAEAARRHLLTETQLRAQADDRATQLSHELRDTNRELTAARERIALLDASRLQLAHDLENEYDTTTIKEKTA